MSSKNREENTEYMRGYRLRAKDIVDRSRRSSHLKQTYGITIEDYDDILGDQGNGCAICGMTPEDNGRRLDVDHCHSTGKVRGLLCHACNLGIGKFRDDPILLISASKYLLEYE